jgi:hypothetical protein
MKKLMLRLFTLFLFLAGLALEAADVWIAKPYIDWTAKDIERILTDSPWAKKVTVTMENGRGGGAGASIQRIGSDGPGGSSGPRGTDGSGGAGANVGPPQTDLFVRWQTAPTVMQALVKSRYGAQAGTSEKAAQRLRPEERYYVIWVAGLPNSVAGRELAAKASLLALTTLAVKRADPIVAADVIFDPGPGRGRITDAHFLFPRKTAFSPDDKEVEFTTKFGKTKVQAKFTLKNMAINGKLVL